MKKRSSIVWFLFFISLLWIYFNLDFFTSVIPGWNTAIYPVWEKALAVIVVVFVFSVTTIVLINVFKPKIRK